MYANGSMTANESSIPCGPSRKPSTSGSTARRRGNPRRRNPRSAASHRQKRGGGNGDSKLEEKRRKVIDYLRANGPKSREKVADATGISKFGPGSIGSVLADERFHISADGIVSTTTRAERGV
jgi:hypothetical protein